MRTRSTLTGADPVKDPVLRLSNAPVAVSGQLKDGGTSLSGDVVAMAWPNAEQLNALPEGANVPLLAVAHARTGTDGRYDLASTRRLFLPATGQPTARSTSM